MVPAPAPQRSDRLSADAPEWHPSSCFTYQTTAKVEDTPSPPPNQREFSSVEAVPSAAAAVAPDAAVVAAAMPAPCPEGDGEGAEGAGAAAPYADSHRDERLFNEGKRGTGRGVPGGFGSNNHGHLR